MLSGTHTAPITTTVPTMAATRTTAMTGSATARARLPDVGGTVTVGVAAIVAGGPETVAVVGSESVVVAAWSESVVVAGSESVAVAAWSETVAVADSEILVATIVSETVAENTSKKRR